MKVNVVKSFLPPKEEYLSYIDKIWDNNWLTNNGPLLQDLEESLQNYLGINKLMVVSNGTVALQIALKALGLKGEIITTPYSYCATTTSILWENCSPIFVDIDSNDYNIDSSLIESKIGPKTTAILATHVYGNPCDLQTIEELAKRYSLKVIYDAAHAFGVSVGGKSLLHYGDISTCSFHATKVFHTVEGGSISTTDSALFEKMKLYRSFGHINDDYFSLGINGKNSEFHAAMGLSNLPYVAGNIEKRKLVFEQYNSLLDFSKIQRPVSPYKDLVYNYAYYPIVLPTKELTRLVIEKLNSNHIFPRRYFYPSLNLLSYIDQGQACPVSESIAERVISLPLYPDLEEKYIGLIANLINSCL